VLAHERRRIVHFAATAHPTAEWAAQQLREAFPWDSAPRFLLRDRDRIFGRAFVEQVKVMGIKQVLSAPRSPWQRAYVERMIGTIRRECLDHLIVFNEASLCRHLQAFIGYYHRTRTHLALDKDARTHGLYSRRMLAASSPSPKWAVCITGTNAERPEKHSSTLRQRTDAGCPPVCNPTTGRSSTHLQP
jgi:transposase InsO family protein